LKNSLQALETATEDQNIIAVFDAKNYAADKGQKTDAKTRCRHTSLIWILILEHYFSQNFQPHDYQIQRIGCKPEYLFRLKIYYCYCYNSLLFFQLHDFVLPFLGLCSCIGSCIRHFIILPKEYGSGSTCDRRYQEWTASKVVQRLWVRLLEVYYDLRGIGWNWQ
jgi:hypothetical protein